MAHEIPAHFRNGTLSGRIAQTHNNFIVYTVCGKAIPCRRINDALSVLRSPYKAVSPLEMPIEWQRSHISMVEKAVIDSIDDAFEAVKLLTVLFQDVHSAIEIVADQWLTDADELLRQYDERDLNCF